MCVCVCACVHTRRGSETKSPPASLQEARVDYEILSLIKHRKIAILQWRACANEPARKPHATCTAHSNRGKSCRPRHTHFFLSLSLSLSRNFFTFFIPGPVWGPNRWGLSAWVQGAYWKFTRHATRKFEV